MTSTTAPPTRVSSKRGLPRLAAIGVLAAWLSCAVVVLSAPAAFGDTPGTFGNTTGGLGYYEAASGFKRVSRFTLADRMTVTQLRAYVDGLGSGSGSQVARPLIYADSGGEPGALLAQGPAVTIADGQPVAWVDFPFSASVSLVPGAYWLGLHFGDSNNTIRFRNTFGGGASRVQTFDTYADGASDPFGVTYPYSDPHSIYAVGTIATTRYVSPTGNDANAGTLAAPWRTIAASLPKLAPGDSLYARGGTYVENVKGITLRSGTATSRITFAAYPGERPVIQGLLWLARPSYWTIDGINVTWNSANGSTDHMVKLGNGFGWRFTNAEVWGARSFAGILVWGDTAGEPSGWSVDHDCIHDTYPSNGTNQDHLIYASTGTRSGSGTIERNLLFNATNGEGIKLAGSDPTSGGATNVTSRYNTIYNTSMSILVGWQSNHNRIDHNILAKSLNNNGLIRSYEIPLGYTDNVATNNVGFAAASAAGMFQVYPTGSYAQVVDGGGNLYPVDPAFDSTSSCAGFHPGPSAGGYGRYSP